MLCPILCLYVVHLCPSRLPTPHNCIHVHAGPGPKPCHRMHVCPCRPRPYTLPYPPHAHVCAGPALNPTVHAGPALNPIVHAGPALNPIYCPCRPSPKPYCPCRPSPKPYCPCRPRPKPYFHVPLPLQLGLMVSASPPSTGVRADNLARLRPCPPPPLRAAGWASSSASTPGAAIPATRPAGGSER